MDSKWRSEIIREAINEIIEDIIRWWNDGEIDK